MRDTIHTLFSDDKNLDLYLGIVDTVEGLAKAFPADAWKRRFLGDAQLEEALDVAIKESGINGLGVPEELGGMGGGVTGMVIACSVLAEHGLLSLGAILTAFSRAPLLKYGTPSQVERYGIPTVNGEKSFCLCVTEPDAGTNTFNISTRAIKRDNKWILKGQKIYITRAAEADYGFLVAKTGIEKPGALSIFVLDMKSPGIECQKLNIDIFPGESQYTVFFDDVEMPADALIGEEGKGAYYMFEGLNAERLQVAAMALGTGYLALKQTLQYVNERTLFGKRPIGAYQAVQHPLAQGKADADAARLTMLFAAKKFDMGEEAGAYANSAKLLASNAATALCDAAIQFHGGGAFDRNACLTNLFMIARGLRVVPINNEMVLNYIAEHTLGLPKSY